MQKRNLERKMKFRLKKEQFVGGWREFGVEVGEPGVEKEKLAIKNREFGVKKRNLGLERGILG